jgi:hypothetical protein
MKPALWFQLHRAIQTTGLIFAIVGFIMALSFVSKGNHITATHHKLGLTVMIIGLLQPLNALIRPHPTPRTTMRMVRMHSRLWKSRRCPSL